MTKPTTVDRKGDLYETVNTISKLLATLISSDELKELLEKHNYIDVARDFKVEDLLDFFMADALEKII